jgi:hypothetical protein
MSDLLRDARDMRQKLYRLEVLLEIEKARPSRGSAPRKGTADPERAAAIRTLTRARLIEPVAGAGQFRPTPEGREFLRDLRAKVRSGNGEFDWTRADEIEFSKL